MLNPYNSTLEKSDGPMPAFILYQATWAAGGHCDAGGGAACGTFLAQPSVA